MATKKRIKDITNTGSEDDLKSENFLALDGPNGSKKIPGDAFTPSGRTASISSSIAPEFDPDRVETYPAGFLVMHEGELREFTVDHPTGPWISGDNRAANVAGKFGKLNAGESLTDAASITVPNNALSTLSSSQATLTLNVNVAAGEVPNFAVEITAGTAITLTVTKTTGGVATTLKYAEAAGNTLESGKMYQITCVGSCWTLAEFVTPVA